MNFPPLDLPSHSDSSDEFYEPGDRQARAEYATFFAPVAEQSVLSQNVRERFGKLIGTHEDCSEIMAVSEGTTRPYMGNRVSQSIPSSAESRERKSSSYMSTLAPPARRLSVSSPSTTPTAQSADCSHVVTQNRVKQLSGSAKESRLESPLEKRIDCLGLRLSTGHAMKGLEDDGSADSACPFSPLDEELNPLSPTREKMYNGTMRSTFGQSSDPVSPLSDSEGQVLTKRRQGHLARQNSQSSIDDAACGQLEQDDSGTRGATSSVSVGTVMLTKPRTAAETSSTSHAAQTTGETAAEGANITSKYKVRLRHDHASTVATTASRSKELASAHISQEGGIAPSTQAAEQSPTNRESRFRPRVKRSFADPGSDASTYGLHTVGIVPGQLSPQTIARRALDGQLPHPTAPEKTGFESGFVAAAGPSTKALLTAAHPVKPSIDLGRSVRSQASSTHLGGPVEPINSSRVSTLRLPYAPSEFDMLPTFDPRKNIEVTVPYAPTLPLAAEKQSYFSDNTSHTPALGIIRKKLQDIKQKLPVPRAPSVDTAVRAGRRKSSSSGRSKTASRQQRHSEDVTVGMSNFEYSKRKVVDRLRGWWRRHLSQRRRHLGRQREESYQRDAAWLADSLGGV